jgi:O-antigen ligase
MQLSNSIRGRADAAPPEAAATHDVPEHETGSSLAFAGVFLFTFLLYLRPSELWPETLGDVPITKIVAISAVIVYLVAKAAGGRAVTIWPLELKMVFLLVLLGLAFMPLAASPSDSLDLLSETFIKVVIVFLLMINVVDRRSRLVPLLRLVVLCGAMLAAFAIHDYQIGALQAESDSLIRVRGVVGGIFGNSNDLATALAVLLPIAVGAAVTTKGLQRILYFACAGLMAAGVLVTFSRGGFLGLLASCAVLVWKMGRANRLATALVGGFALGMVLVAAPGGYGGRILTIFDTASDPTGSAQERTELLKRGIELAVNHPIVGVGMGNFHIYSIHEKVAHNAYVETAAELGVVGFLAYLTLLVAPFRSLRRIERDTRTDEAPDDDAARLRRETYLLCVALQASFVAYMVCSFFASIEYQWLLYYIVAHAVAMRRIHAAHVATAGEGAETALVPVPSSRRRGRGVLWDARPRGRGAIAPALQSAKNLR